MNGPLARRTLITQGTLSAAAVALLAGQRVVAASPTEGYLTFSRQTVTPGTKLGQVGAIFLTVNTGVRPLGAALGGAVGEHWGYGAALWLVVFGFAVQLWLIWHSPVRRLHQLPNAHDAVPTAVR